MDKTALRNNTLQENQNLSKRVIHFSKEIQDSWQKEHQSV
jgi:hypothetical protein